MPIIAPSDIKGLAAVPQALDDQWVPQAVLHRRTGDRTASLAQVRAEYRRALLNANQVVLNRAYLWNSPAVYGDFAAEGPEREAFIGLVNSKAIVPYLFKEQQPWEKPRFPVREEGEAAWTRMRETDLDPTCVRLALDDDENAERCGEMAARFAEKCSNLNFKRAARLCSDLGLPAEAKTALRVLLRQVNHMAADAHDEDDGTYLQRADIYAKHITGATGRADAAPSSDPVDVALKELVDLHYNANLPDTLRAIGGVDTFLLTPAGSPSRLVLQEQIGDGVATDADQLAALVSGITFDETLRQIEGPGFADLTLRDLARVRTSDQWLDYISSARALVESQRHRIDPQALSGEGGLHDLYQRYNAVIERLATDRSGDVDRGDAPPGGFALWSPRVKLVIAIGALIVEVIAGGTYRVLGLGLRSLAAGVAASDLSSVRAVIEGRRDRGEADLDMTIDLASITVKDPRGAATAVIQALKDRHFVEEPVPTGPGREAEVINDPNLAAG